MKKILAFISQICPFCVARRKWPESSYAKVMSKVEKTCPFCKAYDEIHKPKSEDSNSANS